MRRILHVIAGTTLACLALPALATERVPIPEDGWTQYDRTPAGGGFSAVVDSAFAPRVIAFEGSSEGDGNGWEIPVGRAADVVTARVRAIDGHHMTIIVRTIAESGPRTLRWSTDAALPNYGRDLNATLPAALLDGRTHDIALDVGPRLAAASDPLVSIERIRIRSAGLRLDDLATEPASLATKTVSVSAPSAVLAPVPDAVTPAPGMANATPRGAIDPRRDVAAPGVRGFGQHTRGGRGGKLVIVDSLACDARKGDGRTTFREALEARGDVAPGPRIIVFDVGGAVDCGDDGEIHIRGDVTVLGQTAPAPGIHLVARLVQIKHERQVALHSFQILATDPAGVARPTKRTRTAESGRALSIVASSADTTDIAIIGLSMTGSTDDTNAFTGPKARGEITRLTIQRTAVFEGDGCSSHPESHCAMKGSDKAYAFRKASYYHAMGMGFNSTKPGDIHHVSMIDSFQAHVGFRAPIIRGAHDVEIVGVTTYNAARAGLNMWGRPARTLLLDNEVRRGPNSANDGWSVKGEGVVAARNVGTGKGGASKAFPARGQLSDFDASGEYPTPWPRDLACVGPRFRDANLERVIGEYRRGTGEAGIGTHGDPLVNDGDGGRHWRTDPDYYASTRHPAGYDTDRDGMADAWERTHGLHVGAADHAEDADDDGLTNVEEFAASVLREALRERGCGA